MKTKLEDIKSIIEDEVGYKIDIPSRRREVTYSRAVFCQLAKEYSDKISFTSLKGIGSYVKRDHASVIHNLNVIFPYAMQEAYFRNLYQTLKAIFILDREVIDDTEEMDQLKFMSEKIVELQEENNHLKVQLSNMDGSNKEFIDLVKDLSVNDLDDVMNKVKIFVKLIKRRTYL